MMAKKKLNGSVDRLATALRDVFTEAVEEAVVPVIKRLDGVDDRLDGIDEKLVAIDKDLVEIKGRQDHHQRALDGLKNKTPAR